MGMRPKRLARAVAVAAATLGLLATAAVGPATADPGAAASTRADTGHDDALDAALQKVRDAGGIGVVARVDDATGRWKGSTGKAHLDPDVPARPDAQFRAGSITKQLVSVMVLQEVARGRLWLNSTIDDVLPGLWPGRGDVTVKQMLSHTSGMPEMLTPLLTGVETREQFLDVVSKRYTDRDLLTAAQTQPWTFEPGTNWSYSNTNYLVLGMMLKKLTHLPVPALVWLRVFAPAGMWHSRFATHKGMWPTALHEYAQLDGLLDLGRQDPTLFSSAGSLVTTTGDLARFRKALNQGRLIPKALVKQMETPVSTPGAPDSPYGLGSFRLPDTCDASQFVYGHDGATFGTLSLSVGTHDGRRVTISTTGRDLTTTQPVLEQALFTFAGTALSLTCRTPALRSDDGPPFGLDPGQLPITPAPGVSRR